MNKISKFPWRFLWTKDKNGLAEKSRVDDLLDSITFLRSKILSDIESVRARVDGEDLWFTCYPHREKKLKLEERK
jgi:hypothetical protein